MEILCETWDALRTGALCLYYVRWLVDLHSQIGQWWFNGVARFLQVVVRTKFYFRDISKTGRTKSDAIKILIGF